MQQRYISAGRRVWDKQAQKYVRTCASFEAARIEAQRMNEEAAK